MSITPDSVLLSKLLFDVVKDRQAKTGRQDELRRNRRGSSSANHLYRL
ncbi:hypothetical protein [Paraburkholderia phenoliruptrix]|nr:hypothetical protein [Paraburkholderia phenoliruptrix]